MRKVQLNGEKFKEFIMHFDVKQGDSLSFSLFLFIKVMSRLIKTIKEKTIRLLTTIGYQNLMTVNNLVILSHDPNIMREKLEIWTTEMQKVSKRWRK